MNSSIETFKSWIHQSSKIVFFGGAGVSTESGIPDFRSVDGLYSQTYSYPPEIMISHSFFMSHPEEFFRFYRDKLIHNAKPNITHFALAKLEEENKLKAIVTQNIDGLHQDAGSKNVLELHGSILRNYCIKCKKFYPFDFIVHSMDIPYCDCSGIVRPNVVLYEEMLDDNIVNASIKALEEADMVIVGGTSLVVYPAAGLLSAYKGNKLVLINKSETSFDKKANLVIHDSLGNVFKEIE